MFINKENKTLIKIFLDTHYPLTIIADRYEGAYSKGKFLAFPVEYHQLPKGPLSSDIPCGEFWNREDKLEYFIGKGDTIEDAINDLHNKYDDYLLYI